MMILRENQYKRFDFGYKKNVLYLFNSAVTHDRDEEIGLTAD